MSRRLKILTACGWTGGELPLIAERIIKEADKRMDAVRPYIQHKRDCDIEAVHYAYEPECNCGLPSTEWRHSDDCLKQRDRITELEAQLEAVRLEHRKEYDRAEMETGRAKDAEAQLDAVRDAYPDLIGIEIALRGENDYSDLCRAQFEQHIQNLKTQLDELRTTGQALLDATGHSTWSKLFKAPQVETAIRDFKAALQGEKE